MKRLLLTIMILALLLASCAQPSASPTLAPLDTPAAEGTDLSARIERVENGLIGLTENGQVLSDKPMTLTERMKHYKVPGVSIAVINDYQVEWAKGYGVPEAGGDELVTPDTLFNAGSIVKPVSAAAALALVERGLLDLDENVNDKLVSWQVPENEYTVEEKVTLRRLLIPIAISNTMKYNKGDPNLLEVRDEWTPVTDRLAGG